MTSKDSFARSVVPVAEVVRRAGFDSVHRDAVDALVEIMGHYITETGKRVKDAQEHSQRTQPHMQVRLRFFGVCPRQWCLLDPPSKKKGHNTGDGRAWCGCGGPGGVRAVAATVQVDTRPVPQFPGPATHAQRGQGCPGPGDISQPLWNCASYEGPVRGCGDGVDICTHDCRHVNSSKWGNGGAFHHPLPVLSYVRRPFCPQEHPPTA